MLHLLIHLNQCPPWAALPWYLDNWCVLIYIQIWTWGSPQHHPTGISFDLNMQDLLCPFFPMLLTCSIIYCGIGNSVNALCVIFFFNVKQKKFMNPGNFHFVPLRYGWSCPRDHGVSILRFFMNFTVCTKQCFAMLVNILLVMAYQFLWAPSSW